MAATYYLHGELDLSIVGARGLPRSKSLFHPNVLVSLEAVQIARTRASATSDPQNPAWNQRFVIPLAHPAQVMGYMIFEVRDNDTVHSKPIGFAPVSLNRIESGQTIDEWFHVGITSTKEDVDNASIRLRISFKSCHSSPIFSRGIPDNYEARGTYFPLRRGGEVTLYQDAHVGVEGRLPVVQLDGGRVFRRENCWQDICSAMLEARRMIYITGWSVDYKTRLVREPTTKPLPEGSDLMLGNLLKKKADEGVRVVLLVWDDPTSLHKLMGGIMQTHDEETRNFFKHSSVICVLATRLAHCAAYTHHQKSVILDTKGQGNKRKISAFIGGLDLCGGRYDTPQHRLYRDIDTVFADDYSNPSLEKGVKGPREPWHDLHCKIEGPGAYDVLKNFEKRWLKSIDSSKIGKLLERLKGVRLEDALVKIENDPLIAGPSATLHNVHPDQQWHVQIFRSIDSGSLKGFPMDVQEIEEQNLVRTDKVVIDRSIQMAYVQAIRSAQHFIYIENQYFIGSSFAWPSHEETGADNLVPIELALKIASKIKARERFAVYIVIPMWPEGDPRSRAQRNILYWQRLTMQMMYKIVAEEMKCVGLDNAAHPTDYLNFYCLGNREEYGQSSFTGHDSQSECYRRFMVYVHSKGMIVDDSYVIVGSANINERSMAGSRDTEIAMGAYQPHHTWTKKGHPRGQVYGYRMSLWAEHIGSTEECFKDPGNLECVKYVNGVARDNWKRYTDEKFTQPLQGHILKYPMEVDADGNLKALVGHENFPDAGGKVEGRPSHIPDVLNLTT